jgi:tRNA 2-(methylsulfanyl)-N6-isopentenyladenosine37 hydroxylase
MLHLQSETDARWLKQVDSDLEAILIDHAHCEHKAAATAMSLLGSYICDRELTDEMTNIIAEELEHFEMVLDLMSRRGIAFRLQQPGTYGRSLNALVRPNEPERAVDRLLIAGLIEARSCERFKLLAEHVEDAELSAFYHSLFESEARHHSTYTRLARKYQPIEVVNQRLEQRATQEAEIIAIGCQLPRMHS